MTDLAAWLREQFDEDERLIAEHPDEADGGELVDHLGQGLSAETESNYPSWSYLRIAKSRALAEVAAKRRILEEIFRYEAKIDSEWGCCCSADHIAAGRCPETNVAEITALRWLALPYADRPGYDPT